MTLPREAPLTLTAPRTTLSYTSVNRSPVVVTLRASRTDSRYVSPLVDVTLCSEEPVLKKKPGPLTTVLPPSVPPSTNDAERGVEPGHAGRPWCRRR